ncbi:MAG: hypothetical protein V1706_08055 [Pseudomonadota bacterium]
MKNSRKILRRLSQAAGIIAAAGLIFPAPTHAATTIYTVDSDFDIGILNGVNHDAPDNDQLQLNTTGTTFPIMWIANAGEDSVSRIDTDANCETARYKTWHNIPNHGAWSGPAPSRTAVDIEGNVYVANRHFDGRPAQVMKILAEGGIDRNGNGVIDTSFDANNDCTISAGEMIPLVDSNSNGTLDPDELLDERVAWAVQVGPNNGLGRSLCIDTEGDIWLGLYNSHTYYELNAGDGSIKSGPNNNALTNYGCLVDGNGKLWSADLGVYLGELDTVTKAYTNRYHGNQGSNYGIALGNDKVYLGSQSSRSYIEYDPVTNIFSNPAAAWTYTLGISVDGDGDIVLGRNPIYKFAPDGSVVWSKPHPVNPSDVRGVIVDANNDVWTVNLSNNNISKFDGVTGNHIATIPVGYQPYTYSDATGFAARNITTPSGIWNVVNDSGTAGTLWQSIVWNAEPEGFIPAGASIKVEARSADSLAALTAAPFTTVSNGVALTLTGQFIGLRVTLQPDTDGNTPILSDLTITSADTSRVCDVNDDGAVNIADISLINANRNTTNITYDIDGDGVVTVLDSRKCVLECDKPRCAY